MTSDLHPAVAYHVLNSLGWPDLRPLQRAAVEPVRAGADCLLLAPTAGGKTEAAVFPLLSRMVEEEWQGLSVLYVTPMRALLNNLHPRIESYGAWIGRSVGLWHGDVGDSARKRLLEDRPDILLTTPESLESMLVSRRVDHRALFGGVRAIVIDELHAFAGADRGWHLLAVLERIQRLAARPIQRIGLSATVGNPDAMLRWMQGSGADRPARIVADTGGPVAEIAITLDYVGTIANAAQVISRLHKGEKRLVFCESRASAEELAFELRERAVTTFVSHSSLSLDERRQSERAFAESRDCVIVATSTLELGVDIGDLDQVLQVDAPKTVASFLQRLGRSGRRAGTTRSMTFLTTSNEALVRAAAILLLWRRGFVEPVVPPPTPRHIAAQQLLALTLQEGHVGASTYLDWWCGLAAMDDAAVVLDHLRAAQFLSEDGGLLFMGPAGEKAFGRRYFMELLSSFTTERELRVIAGQREIGTVSPLSVATASSSDKKQLLLSGRAWRIQSVDWERFEVLVAEDPAKGKVRWPGGMAAQTFELARAQREVALGATPDITLVSQRAVTRLEAVRAELSAIVDETGLVFSEGPASVRFHTWAGVKANMTVIAALGIPEVSVDNTMIEWPARLSPAQLHGLDVSSVLPRVDPEAVESLKFSVALPLTLASATLAARLVDRAGAADVIHQRVVVRSEGSVGGTG